MSVNVRLPLQSGVSGWDSRARSLAAVIPGLVVLALDVWWLFRVFSAHARADVALPNAIAVPLFLVLGIVGVILIAEGMEAGAHAARTLATDAVLEEGGLRVGDASIPRSALATAAVLEKERNVRGVWRSLRYVFGKGAAKETYAELVVQHGGAPVVLAEATTYAERRALTRLAEILAGRVAAPAGAFPSADAVRRRQLVAAWPMRLAFPLAFGAALLARVPLTVVHATAIAGGGLALIGLGWLAVRPAVLARAAWSAATPEVFAKDRSRARLGAIALLVVVGASGAWVATRARAVAEPADVRDCRGGDLRACKRHGAALAATDPAAAVRFLAPHCVTGDAASAGVCEELGYWTWKAGDAAAGEPILRAACDAGDQDACVFHRQLCKESPCATP